MSEDLEDVDTPDFSDLFASNDQVSIAEELPYALLLKALPRPIRRRLERGDPLALTVTVPGPDWVGPIGGAAKALNSDAKVFCRDGSAKNQDKPSVGSDEVSAALIQGRAVIGVSHAPQRYLPSSLVVCADGHLAIASPDSATLRRLLRSCASGSVPRFIPEGVATGLAYHEIVAAFRANASPRAVLQNLAHASSAKSRVSTTDTTPPLEKLPGYSGDAREWGMALVDGINRWRGGKAAWSELPTAAVLAGPPGTGKTLFAKAVARSCGVPIVVTSVGQWFSTTDGNLGDVCRALQLAWDAAKSSAPSIFFIDELDALPSREKLSDRAREWWTSLITLALTLFDGAVTDRTGIVLLGATNHRAQLDPALIRSGRFERVIEIPLPNSEDLASILRFHLGGDLPGTDLNSIVRLATGACAADAPRWARDARATAKAAGRDMTTDDLVVAIAPADTRPLSDIRRVAVHEAGHAVAQIALGGVVESVTIVVTEETGGRTRTSGLLPDPPTARDLDREAVVSLAGRAAEAALLGAPSAGAESDLAKATELVCMQHASSGLGGSLLHLAPSGSASALLIDPVFRKTVEQHIARLYAEAEALVRERQAAVTAVTDALVKRRVLSGAQVRVITLQHAKTSQHAGGVKSGGAHE